MRAGAATLALWLMAGSASADEAAAKSAGEPVSADPAPEMPAPELTAADLELLRDLDLLSELEMLRSWDPESDLPIPSDPIAQNVVDEESKR